MLIIMPAYSLYYQFFQLGTGGHTQKAQPVQSVYPKP